MTVRSAWAPPAALIACLALGGCGSGPLTMDVQVVGQARSLVYRLEPDGRLAVTAGGGLAGGTSPEPVYEAHLDEKALAGLKKVIFNSGFLVADPPYRTPLVPGVTTVMEITLGLWHNRIDTRGARVESVARIVAEMNRHLPPPYALPETDPQADREQRKLDEYLKEMRQP